MLQEILQKESINDEDMKVIMANYDQLSDSDLIRLGFKQPVSEETNDTAVAPKIRKKK